MPHTEKFRSPILPENFSWFNEPTRYQLGNGLEIYTDAETDFLTLYGVGHWGE